MKPSLRVEEAVFEPGAPPPVQTQPPLPWHSSAQMAPDDWHEEISGRVNCHEEFSDWLFATKNFLVERFRAKMWEGGKLYGTRTKILGGTKREANFLDRIWGGWSAKSVISL